MCCPLYLPVSYVSKTGVAPNKTINILFTVGLNKNNPISLEEHMQAEYINMLHAEISHSILLVEVGDC